MAFSRPTLSQLQTRIQSDMLARIGGTTPALRRGVLGVLASVLAAAAHGLYAAIQFFSRQAVPITAEDADLESWASLWAVARRQPQAAIGSLLVSGEIGATVPLDTRLQSTGGIEYRVTTATTVAVTGVATVPVAAVVTGAATNQVAGIILSFVSPPVGIDNSAEVIGDGLIGGIDLESDDSLRARLVERVSNPPQGGAAADYEAWALGVVNVSRAWCFPLYSGAGTVRVYIADDNYTGGSTTAASGTVSAVAGRISSLRPVTAVVTVLAPTRQPVNISLAITPDTAEVRAAVAANLADLFRTEAEPEGPVLITHIREAVSSAKGEYNHAISTPTADVTASAGNICTLGTITWL